MCLSKIKIDTADILYFENHKKQIRALDVYILNVEKVNGNFWFDQNFFFLALCANSSMVLITNL